MPPAGLGGPRNGFKGDKPPPRETESSPHKLKSFAYI